MGWLVSINGEVSPGERARVSVLDNGFIFGDSVYETLRTYAGRPFALERHIRRLRASANRLGITIPVGDENLALQLNDLLAQSGNRESYIRMVVSRGVGDISYDFDAVKGPTIVFAVKELEPVPEAVYQRGIPVAIVGIRRNHPQALDPAIKSCNLLNNILAMREAQARGAEEAILLNHQGDVTEGASSNVFVVKDGRVRTPPASAGILVGITREIVFEVGPPNGIPVQEARLRPRDLLGADEAFITSSVRDALPISSVDGTPIGSGRPGPTCAKLLIAFRDYARQHSA